MNKVITTISSLLLVSTVMVSNAHAQYVGPSHNNKAGSVADILKSPVDDQRVVLEGVILKKVGHEKYIFSDGSAEIRIDIDDEKMPTTRIDDKTKVQIHGDVDIESYRSPQIDVDAIILR